MLKSISSFAIILILSAAPAYSQGFIVSTVAGNHTFGYSGDDGPAIAAQLMLPGCVALDRAGNLYIADWYNNAVRLVNPNGVIRTVAGIGSLGYSGDGGPAVGAQLAYPCGLAVDAAGDLFIADSGNNAIREVTPDGNINTVAGNGTRGYTGDGAQATNAQLYAPYAVAVDAAGDLFISDSNNHAIREVFVGGEILTIAGNGVPGYVGDGGQGIYSQFNYPKGLALDSAGDLYVADFGNSVIREIYANGRVATVAGVGAPGYSGDGGPATSAVLSYPESVALDAAGNLYIADTLNQVIRVVSSGVITTIAGNGTSGYSGDGGPASSAQFFYPKGVAAGAGAVYIADWDNGVIRLLTPIVTPQ